MPKIVDDEIVYMAVMRSIIARGYAGATTKQIAAIAEVSEMTLFRKYGSKAQLVIQALVSILDQMNFSEMVRYSGDVFADLSQIVDHYQKLVKQHGPFMIVLLAEIPRYPELAELVEAQFQIVQNIEELISRYQAEGVLQKEPPLHTVAALIGPLVYTEVMQNAIPKFNIPSTDVSTHIKFFMEGRHLKT
jgi:AcrR family transcriptional regulator